MTAGITTAIEGLEITMNLDEQGTLMQLVGRLNIDSAPAVRDRLLARLREQQPGALTVDLSEVSYLDCAGIATLIEALKIARNRQTTLRLKGLHGGFHHLFEVTGLLALFETYGADASVTAKVM
jgi:anti-anti-sigma factor